jgi:archaellin
MTGLETAIILIAFVTVAAVFGYAVLSAGIFSAEQGKETLYAGLEQAKSSMEVKGSIIAYGAPGADGDLNDCDTAWTPGTGVTAELTVGFGGGHSNMFTLSTTFDGTTNSTVAVGTSNISDLSQKNLVTMYIKADTDISASGNDTLKLALTDGSTAVETISLPALTKDAWTLVTLNINNDLYSGVTVTEVELHYGEDLGSADPITIWLDNIVAGPPYIQADLIVFTVANAIAGKPIDLNPSPTNKTVISYTDQLVHKSNVEFAVSFVGENDGDYLLELGEQAEILVPLGFLDQPPGANEFFGLQMKPPHGSVVTIERTIPANVDAVMDLY